jgi:Fe(3+) dicitrate transport protein
MANLATTCGNQGRLRDYTVWGLEPRVSLALDRIARGLGLEGGLRLHVERQERIQWNGDSPTAREPGTSANAGTAEDNLRRNRALAAFLQPRLERGEWSITAGLRMEHVRYERANRLAADSPVGTTSLTELIPGIGATWNRGERWTVFAGLHRGFAPPRTEDIVTNAGGVTDLEAERSWNVELGARTRLGSGIEGELTLFQLDFSNQVIPASVAGGSGATLTSAGETLHRGMEAALRAGGEAPGFAPGRLSLDIAWTWVAVARFEGERFAYIGTGDVGDVTGKVYQAQNAEETRTLVSLTGRRLPYAPEHTLTAGFTWDYADASWARLETVATTRMFGDPVNTLQTVPDGQQGPIPGHAVWNLTAGYRIRPLHSTITLGVRNLFDARYVVDRTRGLLPGMPRTVQLGAEVTR